MTRFSWFIVSLFVICFSTNAYAGEIEVVISAGETQFDASTANLDDESGTRGAVSVSIGVTPRVSVGTEIAASFTEGGDDVWMPSVVLFAEYRLFPHKKFGPYFRAGLGAVHVHGVTAGIKHDSGESVAGYGAFGLEFGRRFNFRVGASVIATDDIGIHPSLEGGLGMRF